jgi:hypothetical protein
LTPLLLSQLKQTMKKIIAILVILGATQTASFAQTNAMEARAAFMLAEESFGKKDYRATLDYLQQAKTALGGANCRLLYLQIIATKELHAKNPNLADLLLPLITEFEQAPDLKDFNEDKALEVAKLKLTTKLEQKAMQEKAERDRAIREAQALVVKAMDNIFNRYPPLNLTAAQLDAAYPQLNTKKWKSNKTYSTVLSPSFMDYDFPKERYPFGEIDKDVDYRNQIASVQFQPLDGVQKTFSFVGILVYTDKNVNPGSVASALIEADAIIERYRKELGPPTIPVDVDDKDAHYTVYRWETKERRLDVCKLYYPRGTQPVVKLFEEVRRLK